MPWPKGKARNWSYRPNICPNCSKEYIPTNGKQIYCGGCNFNCHICGKEISKGNFYCRSCWQLGDRNNSKKPEVRALLSEQRKGNKFSLGKFPSEETRKKLSDSRIGQKNHNFGKVTYGTGRCKWYDYKSSIAGEVRLQGTYELRMAAALDALLLPWEKNKDYFIYDNGRHSYIPDFKINSQVPWYIDTKGWFSEYEQRKIQKVRDENDIALIIATEDILKCYETSGEIKCLGSQLIP